jgi:hypothetical protein
MIPLCRDGMLSCSGCYPATSPVLPDGRPDAEQALVKLKIEKWIQGSGTNSRGCNSVCSCTKVMEHNCRSFASEHRVLPVSL